MDRVDVVVVGGGLAGLAAATALAQSGTAVRLYARGGFEGRPGGGLVSGATLSVLGGPQVPVEVPFDRTIVERRWSVLAADGDVTLDFQDAAPLLTSEELRSVRNTTLAPWLAARARSLGADLRPGTPVASLRRDPRGRVTGVSAAGGEVEATVTLLADGGALAADPRARRPEPAVEVVESYWELPARTITARLGTRPGTGAVLEYLLGALSPERPAGGYLLPFRTGIAVGAVAERGRRPGEPPVAELLRRLEAHPSVAPILRDGRRGPEVSVRVADPPTAGRPLSGPGFLALGRAGGLEAASGTRYVAVDAALRSATMAAEVCREVLAARDPTPLRLRAYGFGLRAEGLLGELRGAAASGRRYRAAPGVARDIPRLLHATLHELMTESGGPKRPVVATARAVRRREKVSRRTLLRAALVAGRWR